MLRICRILVSVSVMLAAGTATAQVDSLWTRTIGGGDNDGLRGLVGATGGGTVAVGYTFSFGAGLSDIFLTRTDDQGTTQWTHTFGGAGRDYGNDVCRTDDGGYVVTGYTTSTGAGGTDLYLMKTDADGQELWSRTYGGSLADEGLAVCETADGHLIVTGRTESWGAGEHDVWVLKTDAAGDTLWTRSFGGLESDWGSDVCETSDGRYGVVGTTGSYSTNRDIMALVLDPAGNADWVGYYASTGGIDADWGEGLCAMDDGGLALVGWGNDHAVGDAADVWLIRVDADGNEQWSYTYGLPGNYYDFGCSIARTADDGFMICGAIKNPSTQRNELYLLRADASGARLWDQTFTGEAAEWGSAILRVDTGHFVIAGHTDSYGAGGFDGWLVDVVDPSTAVEPSASPRPAIFMSEPAPNPGRSAVAFTLELAEPAELEVRVVNALGRFVCALHSGRLAAGSHTFSWDLRGAEGVKVESGVYFIVADGGASGIRKTVVVR